MLPRHSPNLSITTALAILAASFVTAHAGAPIVPTSAMTIQQDGSWKDNTISPVTNFINFEDPVIRNEIRPVFVYHNIENSFITGGGTAIATGVQVRLALAERFAIFMNQGGYMRVDPEYGETFDGLADLGFGMKYALIDSEASQFILTPGVGFTFPTGDEDILHGRGDGEWNFFLSSAKGFGNLHFTGNVGWRLPLERDLQSSTLHYSLQADYFVSRWFIPFVFANAWTITESGNSMPLDAEGYDFFNFGSSQSEGSTQATVGLGFRVRLLENMDFGVAYEKAVVEPKGHFDDRFTFDLSIRF